MIAKFLLKALNLLELVPGWVWFLLVVILTLMVLGSKVELALERSEHAETAAKLSKSEIDFHGYRAQAEENAERARLKVLELETNAKVNTERIKHEQKVREDQLAADIARLRGSEQRVRDELTAFRAAAARDAKSGNAAGLAAKAATATELYEACGIEYRGMAAEAERVRLQALGLWDYVRGNAMCAQPFGPAAQIPAK